MVSGLTFSEHIMFNKRKQEKQQSRTYPQGYHKEVVYTVADQSGSLEGFWKTTDAYS